MVEDGEVIGRLVCGRGATVKMLAYFSRFSACVNFYRTIEGNEYDLLYRWRIPASFIQIHASTKLVVLGYLILSYTPCSIKGKKLPLDAGVILD